MQLATTGLALGAALACGGSSSSSPSQASVVAAAVCPPTADQTIGQACASEGLLCAPEYSCGPVVATLSCTCVHGTFECSDGAGQALGRGAVPTCPATAANAGPCPTTERAARFAPCLEQGLLCAYPSACPNAFDTCECFPGTTSAGVASLRFECFPRACAAQDAAAAVGSMEEAGAQPYAADATVLNGDSGEAGDALDSSSHLESAAPDTAADGAAPDTAAVDAAALDGG